MSAIEGWLVLKSIFRPDDFIAWMAQEIIIKPSGAADDRNEKSFRPGDQKFLLRVQSRTSIARQKPRVCSHLDILVINPPSEHFQ